MWPRGNLQAQLATIDDRLLRIAEALREARGNHELANVAICEQRYDELLDERNRVAAMIPLQRDPE